MTKIVVSTDPFRDIANALPQKNAGKQSEKKARKRKPRIPPPRSYRLSVNEIDLLKDITESVSEKAGRMRITDTLTIKALIRLAQDLETDKILSEIKKIKSET